MIVMKSTINIKSDLVAHEQLCKEFYSCIKDDISLLTSLS